MPEEAHRHLGAPGAHEPRKTHDLAGVHVDVGVVHHDSVLVERVVHGPVLVSSHGIMNDNIEQSEVEEYRRDFHIKCNSIDVNVGTLSGGNQQKVVLAKWVPRSSFLLGLH